MRSGHFFWVVCRRATCRDGGSNPTAFLRIYQNPCGSEACPRRRPPIRPDCADVFNPCRSEPAREGVCDPIIFPLLPHSPATTSTLVIPALYAALRQPLLKESDPCPKRPAIALNVRASSANIPLRATASITVATLAPTIMQAVKHAAVKVANARLQKNSSAKKVEPIRAPLPVSGCHHPAARYVVSRR